MDAGLRGETDTLRQQAGAVISGMQEQASAVIGRMLQDQHDAHRRLGAAVASAESKFAEVDALVLSTRGGLEEVGRFAKQLAAQQEALQHRQGALEAHLRQAPPQPHQPPQPSQHPAPPPQTSSHWVGLSRPLARLARSVGQQRSPATRRSRTRR